MAALLDEQLLVSGNTELDAEGLSLAASFVCINFCFQTGVLEKRGTAAGIRDIWTSL